MRHRAKGRQLSPHLEPPAGDAQQHGHEPVRARPGGHHRGQGQGAAAVRREADHPGAAGRPARAPAGASGGSRTGRPCRGCSARSVRASPRGPAATPASSSSATARATGPTSPGSSCCPSDRPSPALRQAKGDPGVPFFLTRRCSRGGQTDGDSRLGGLRDPVTLQALRADPDAPGRALDEHPDRLQVRIPAPLGPVVGVADIVAGDRPLAAHGADPRHKLHPR